MKFQRQVFFLLSLFLVACSTPDGQPSLPPGTSKIISLAQRGQDELLLLTSGYGLWSSTDAGESWLQSRVATDEWRHSVFLRPYYSPDSELRLLYGLTVERNTGSLRQLTTTIRSCTWSKGPFFAEGQSAREGAAVGLWGCDGLPAAKALVGMKPDDKFVDGGRKRIIARMAVAAPVTMLVWKDRNTDSWDLMEGLCGGGYIEGLWGSYAVDTAGYLACFEIEDFEDPAQIRSVQRLNSGPHGLSTTRYELPNDTYLQSLAENPHDPNVVVLLLRRLRPRTADNISEYYYELYRSVDRGLSFQFLNSLAGAPPHNKVFFLSERLAAIQVVVSGSSRLASIDVLTGDLGEEVSLPEDCQYFATNFTNQFCFNYERLFKLIGSEWTDFTAKLPI